MRAIWLIALLLSSVTSMAQLSVSAKADTTEILIGEQLQITVELTYRGERPEVTWPELKDTLSRQIEIVDASAVEKVRSDAMTTEQQLIHVTSWDTGYFAVPPFIFLTAEGEELMTEPFLLTVKGVAVDLEGPIADIKAPAPEPMTLGDLLALYWPYLVSLIVLAIIILLLLKLTKNKAQDRPESEVEEVVEPPIDPLLGLERMKGNAAFKTADSRQYYTTLTDHLRRFVEQEFDLPAFEQTSSEIITDLETKSLKREERLVLAGIFRQSDMAKFAKSKLSAAQQEDALEKAIDLLTAVKKSKAVLESTEPSAEKVGIDQPTQAITDHE